MVGEANKMNLLVCALHARTFLNHVSSGGLPRHLASSLKLTCMQHAEEWYAMTQVRHHYQAQACQCVFCWSMLAVDAVDNLIHVSTAHAL